MISSTGNEAARMRFNRQGKVKGHGITEKALEKMSGTRMEKANLFTIWLQHQEDWTATCEFMAIIEKAKTNLVRKTYSFKKRRVLMKIYGGHEQKVNTVVGYCRRHGLYKHDAVLKDHESEDEFYTEDKVEGIEEESHRQAEQLRLAGRINQEQARGLLEGPNARFGELESAAHTNNLKSALASEKDEEIAAKDKEIAELKKKEEDRVNKERDAAEDLQREQEKKDRKKAERLAAKALEAKNPKVEISELMDLLLKKAMAARADAFKIKGPESIKRCCCCCCCCRCYYYYYYHCCCGCCCRYYCCACCGCWCQKNYHHYYYYDYYYYDYYYY